MTQTPTKQYVIIINLVRCVREGLEGEDKRNET